MWPFNRAKRKHRAIAEYVGPSSSKLVRPWLTLLETLRNSSQRERYEVLFHRISGDFNVMLTPWPVSVEDEGMSAPTLEDFPHVIERLTATWGQPECLHYVDSLIGDNRDGTRGGFPLPVFEELILLVSLLEAHVARFRDGAGRGSTPLHSIAMRTITGNPSPFRHP